MTVITMERKMNQLGEVYMELIDRKKLAKLMVIQGVSQRDVAQAAGWKAHSYVGRLLRGEVKNLEIEPAVRIAAFFGVGVDDLFLTRTTRNAGRDAHATRPGGATADPVRRHHRIAS